MYICLKRLASKLWKKNCPNFLHTMYKVGRKLESVSHPFLAVLSSSVMQQISSFFKQVCFFFKKKCLHVAVFLQSGALYANIRLDPRSKYNWQKSECSKHQQRMGVWECSKTPAGVLWGGSP